MSTKEGLAGQIIEKKMSPGLEKISSIVFEYDMRLAYRAQVIPGVKSGMGNPGWESKHFTKKELLKENDSELSKVVLDKIRGVLLDTGHMEMPP